jgi:ribosomal protein L32
VTTESSYRGAEIACFAVTIIKDAAVLVSLSVERTCGERNWSHHLSECGIITVVTSTITASDGASPVGFLAGEESSFELAAQIITSSERLRLE